MNMHYEELYLLPHSGKYSNVQLALKMKDMWGVDQLPLIQCTAATHSCGNLLSQARTSQLLLIGH